MGLYSYEDNAFIRSIIHFVVGLVVIVSVAWFIVYGFLGQTIISGQSMIPNLEAEDVCLVNRLTYDLGTPKRYDVILFERNDNGKPNVKRVVGLPGEKVQIMNDSIYINGEKLVDERLKPVSLAGIAENTVELMRDEFFVIGDNPESSEDSRFSNIGNVKKSSVKGKLWLKASSFDQLKLIR